MINSAARYFGPLRFLNSDAKLQPCISNHRLPIGTHGNAHPGSRHQNRRAETLTMGDAESSPANGSLVAAAGRKPGPLVLSFASFGLFLLQRVAATVSHMTRRKINEPVGVLLRPTISNPGTIRYPRSHSAQFNCRSKQNPSTTKRASLKSHAARLLQFLLTIYRVQYSQYQYVIQSLAPNIWREGGEMKRE